VAPQLIDLVLISPTDDDDDPHDLELAGELGELLNLAIGYKADRRTAAAQQRLIGVLASPVNEVPGA
jgi:hypothetical protein